MQNPSKNLNPTTIFDVIKLIEKEMVAKKNFISWIHQEKIIERCEAYGIKSVTIERLNSMVKSKLLQKAQEYYRINKIRVQIFKNGVWINR